MEREKARQFTYSTEDRFNPRLVRSVPRAKALASLFVILITLSSPNKPYLEAGDDSMSPSDTALAPILLPLWSSPLWSVPSSFLPAIAGAAAVPCPRVASPGTAPAAAPGRAGKSSWPLRPDFPGVDKGKGKGEGEGEGASNAQKSHSQAKRNTTISRVINNTVRDRKEGFVRARVGGSGKGSVKLTIVAATAWPEGAAEEQLMEQ